MTNIKLLVTDIDNTVFDWVRYYSVAFQALLEYVSSHVHVPVSQLAHEAREIFAEEGSIEFPFTIQRMPSVNAFYGDDIDKMLNEAVEPARIKFLEAAKAYLLPYQSVKDTLITIKKQHQSIPIIALTDAPRYVAMWKLNKLGLLHDFDAVYGLPDPRLPTCSKLGRVKVMPHILLKHLQQSNFNFKGKIRILPDDYEKPGTRGLRTVLMDYEIDSVEERAQVLWVGDNLRKDVGLGKTLGLKTAWAAYGANIEPKYLAILNSFSPPTNIEKHANLTPEHQSSPKPDYVLKQFSDLINIINQ